MEDKHMPLDVSQKTEINFVIDPFFESFPTIPDELIQEVKELKQSLMTIIDKAHRFYWLRECLINITLYFRLEKLSNYPINVAEAQTYILDRITYHLIKLANQINLPFSKLEWYRSNLIFNIIPHKHFSLVFTSEPAPVDGITEAPLPPDMNPIYSYTIVFIPSEEFDDDHPFGRKITIAYAEVSVDCGENQLQETTLELADVPYLRNDAEEDQFKLKIDPKARSKAEHFAAKVALDHLPPFEFRRDILDSKSAKQIITYRYYFNLIKNGFLPITELLNLSSCAGENLTDPIMVELIKKEICNFKTSKELSWYQKAIAINPVFSGLLTQQVISIFDILNLDDDHCKFILHTPITSLVQRKKLSFQQAINIPLYLEEILISSLYVDFFINEKIDWNMFSQIKNYQRLLFLDEKFVKEHKQPTPLNKKFSSFIKNKEITLDQIINLTELATFLLQQHLRLINWYEQKLISLEELNHIDSDGFFELYIRVYSTRLYAIYHSIPYLIENNQDSLTKLVEELPEISIECGVGLFLLQQRFFYELVTIIKVDIANKKSNLPIYDEILKKIDSAEHNKRCNWWNIFNDVIHLVNKTYFQHTSKPIHLTNHAYKSKYVFFNHKRQKTESHNISKREKKFCESLLALADIAIPSEERTLLFSQFR